MPGARPTRGTVAITGVHVALIIFVVLWVASTIMAVIFYTDQETLKKQIADLEDQKAKYVPRGGGESAFADYIDKAFGGATVPNLILDDRNTLAGRITGNAADSTASVLKQVSDTLGQIVADVNAKGDTGLTFTTDTDLLKIAGSLHEYAMQQRDQRLAAVADRDRLATALTQEQAAKAAQKQAYDQQIGDLNEKIKSLEDANTSYAQSRDEEVKKLQDTLAKARDSFNLRTRKLQNELKERDLEIQKLANVVDKLRKELAGLKPQLDPNNLLKVVDGRILRAVPGEQLVYINIGRKENVTLGLTFSVYSSDKGVSSDGKGKATIEVVGLNDHTAECRIVSSDPGDPVIEGDLIHNVVYDRSRKYRFVVAGMFDLDYSGREDPKDAETVRGMISAWGGQVVDTLDERTDFVVLGRAPAQPVGRIPDDADAQAIDRIKQAQKDFEQFQNLRAEAKALSIPILTQTQFLYFVGANVSPPANIAERGL